MENLDQETFAARRATRTRQEDTKVQNMDPEEESAHRSRHVALERTRFHHLSIQQQQRTRTYCTQQEACRVAAMNEAIRYIYNDQKSMNQLNHHNRRGPQILDDDNVS